MTLRIVSLVPSLTELLVLLGAGDRLVGVTTYCSHAGAERVGGSKFFDPAAVLALQPDLVLANTEENQPDRLATLRDAGLRVVETFPTSVADVAPMMLTVADLVGGDARPLVADIDAALDEVARLRPAQALQALTLIWRRPWIGVGPRTYAHDLLRTCGFVNVLAQSAERYPKIDPADARGAAVVLLPDEPYAFGADDLPAVAALTGGARARLVDGGLLTWHGPRTAAALRTFSRLASELAGP